MPLFYTYVLIDPRTEKPFYVGKGTGRRMYVHANNPRNKLLANRIRQIKSQGYKIRYEKLIESEDEGFCFAMEAFFIASIGRSNLYNLTNGGQSPMKDPEVAARMRNALHVYYASPESKVTRAKMRAAKLGTKASLETRQRMSEIRKGRSNPWDTKGMRGHTHSDSTRLAMRSAKIGKRRPLTDFQKAIEIFENEGGFIPEVTALKRRSEKMKGANNPFFGKQHSEQVRAFFRGNTYGRALKGRVFSEETRLKMRLAKLKAFR